MMSDMTVMKNLV